MLLIRAHYRPISIAFLSSFHMIRKTYVCFFFFGVNSAREFMRCTSHAFWAASNIASDIVIIDFHFRRRLIMIIYYYNILTSRIIGETNMFWWADVVPSTSLEYPISTYNGLYIYIDFRVSTMLYVLWNSYIHNITKMYRTNSLFLSAWN